jgi:hypothetical protein
MKNNISIKNHLGVGNISIRSKSSGQDEPVIR